MKYLALGKRIKSFRERKGLSVTELADKSGVPQGQLQKYEKNEEQPIIAHLIQLAKALDVNVADIFRNRPPSKEAFEIIRKKDREEVRAALKKSKGNIFDYAYVLLTTPSDEKHLDAFMIELQPQGKRSAAGKVSHAGEEFIFILEGELKGEIEGKAFHIKAGDSLYLRSTAPHVFYNPGNKNTKAIAVVYPF